MDNFWWMSGFLSDSRFRLLAVSNSSLRFSDFPLTTMDDFFFSMWSQAEVKIWWIAFITSGGTAGIFCVKKEGKPFEWREISRIAHFVKITSEASWFLARKSKQPGVPTSFSQEKKILQRSEDLPSIWRFFRLFNNIKILRFERKLRARFARTHEKM